MLLQLLLEYQQIQIILPRLEEGLKFLVALRVRGLILAQGEEVKFLVLVRDLVLPDDFRVQLRTALLFEVLIVDLVHFHFLQLLPDQFRVQLYSLHIAQMHQVHQKQCSIHLNYSLKK